MRNNILVGKIITAIYLAADKMAIKFDIEGGEPVIARADGDCCSSTWIEEVQGADQIIGSKIVSVEDVGGARYGDDDESYSVIQHYGCKITSEKGYCLIDYRNESNGYYGGNLSWPAASEDSYSYFYGGVYGQNVSKEEWKEIS